MDEFSYLSVLLSIILGLAVTQILKGFRGILLARHKIRIYWPVLVWAFLVLLICCQNWWSMFGMRHRHDWTFAQFAIVLLQTILTYMMAGLIFPDLFGEDVIDLKQSFYAHRGWFFSIAFAIVVVSVLKDYVLDHKFTNPTNLAFHGVFGLTALMGAMTKSERYHKIIAACIPSVFICYIVLLYERMQ